MDAKKFTQLKMMNKIFFKHQDKWNCIYMKC